MTIRLLGLTCGLVEVAWIFAGVALHVGHATEAVKTAFHELKPFYLPALVVLQFASIAVEHGRYTVLDACQAACLIGCWYGLRNAGEDDDRWKRRRRKVAERVQVAGGRLTVVAGESA